MLQEIGKVKDFKGRGLLGRFLYSLPFSTVGEREVVTEPVPEQTAATYTARVISLTLSLAEWTDPAVIQLSPEADAALIGYQKQLEPQHGSNGGKLGHVSGWAGKPAGAVACVAALLHLAEHLGEGYAHPVPEATMGAAIELGEYYTAHALAVFDLMGADPVLGRARSVLDALRGNAWEDVSRRDVFTVLSRAEVPTVTDLEPALALLEDHGYLRTYQPERTGKRGRPPAPCLQVHPALRDVGR